MDWTRLREVAIAAMVLGSLLLSLGIIAGGR
jgi:hypothetical protein